MMEMKENNQGHAKPWLFSCTCRTRLYINSKDNVSQTWLKPIDVRCPFNYNLFKIIFK